MPTVSMNVNGQSISRDVEERTLLVQFLREHLKLTGTHVGCDTSQCGACVIHVDGVSVKSCTMLAIQAEGCEVKTIEGLANNNELHPMQQAFKDNHGLQCGFCTPGMVMCIKSTFWGQFVSKIDRKLEFCSNLETKFIILKIEIFRFVTMTGRSFLDVSRNLGIWSEPESTP